MHGSNPYNSNNACKAVSELTEATAKPVRSSIKKAQPLASAKANLGINAITP